MSQYTPFGKIENYPELNRRVTSREYDSVVQTALDLGIERLFLQDKASATQNYIPSWDF
jgi:putative pyruvate formate lyase activating enzyme